MNKTLWPALTLLTLSPALAATGEVLDATPATLVQVLRSAGYQPTLKPGDAKTSPSIQVGSGEDTVWLYFSGCKAGVCTRVTASNGFEVGQDSAELGPMLAKWNADWYTQAYLDKDGAYLDGTYLLQGGYTRANFVAWFKTYLNELAEFENTLP
ncbi:YbjN domain-containing protein [Deinococcus koreensis]|uniref:YbjN domain-containing protein n=1 Tax=Deinococcus koreensis TaxID=2054903 RepID=A0A2K3USF1_9DEIO|nr:YbjN domain-containing protein [Deinococcus koreensis]PNY79471.1 hypothetical protein CVO96_18735 [Deinococcus koreensis]